MRRPEKIGAHPRAPLPCSATTLSRVPPGSKARAAGADQRGRPLSAAALRHWCPLNKHAASIAHAPGTVASVFLVVEKLRVDGQHATFALLLELHHAVDRGQDSVAEE